MCKALKRHGLLFFGSGLTDPDISLAASLAFFTAFQLAEPAALNAAQFLRGTILRTPLEVEAGTLRLPGGAGLGIMVEETLIPKSSALSA